MTQDTVQFNAEAALKQAALDGALNAYHDLEEEYKRLDAGKSGSTTRFKSALNIVKQKENRLMLEGEVQGYSTDYLSKTSPHATGSENMQTFWMFLAVLFVVLAGLISIFEFLRALI